MTNTPWGNHSSRGKYPSLSFPALKCLTVCRSAFVCEKFIELRRFGGQKCQLMINSRSAPESVPFGAYGSVALSKGGQSRPINHPVDWLDRFRDEGPVLPGVRVGRRAEEIAAT